MALLVSVVVVLSIGFAIAIMRLRSVAAERDEARAAAEHAATHDPLTGLATRSLFVSRLDQALACGVTGALVILDLDRLPRVNDALGHDAGDSVLVEVADRLRTSVRTDDLVARLSGGEFVVLLRTDPTVEIFGIAERLIERIRVTRPTPDGEIDVSARAGMVQWDDSSPPASGADLLRDAERAMHAPNPKPAPRAPVAPTAASQSRRPPARSAMRAAG